MFEALKFYKNYTGSQSKVARVMRENGLVHKKKHNPLSLTKVGDTGSVPIGKPKNGMIY